MKQWFGRILLGMSYLVIFWVLMIMTEFVLVPWDTALVLPETGMLARIMNDFFQMPPGNLLPAIVLVLLSIYLTRRQAPQGFILRAAENIIFVALLLGLFTIAALLNNRVFPYPPVAYDPNYPGYHRSVIPGLTVLMTCVVRLWWQADHRTSAFISAAAH